jgi:hypothetical protein
MKAKAEPETILYTSGFPLTLSKKKEYILVIVKTENTK